MSFAISPTVLIGVVGIVMSLPAWAFFIRAVFRVYRLIASGQPTVGRTDHLLRRAGVVFREVFFHTELIRKPAVAVAHWLVMVGFLFGSLVWFEAYIQTFAPDSGWPILSDLRLYHFVEEVLAWGTVAGIVFLFTLRLSTSSRRRLSRFYGSQSVAAFFVEAVVLVEALGMLGVKAAKIAAFGQGSYVADFGTIYIAQLLPASPVLVSVLALIKLLTGMVWLIVVACNLTWGVAWHRFLAFFSIFFRRYSDGSKALGALPPLTSGSTVLTLESLEDFDEQPRLGVGSLADAPWKMLLDSATCTECGRCQEQCPAWHTEKPLSPKLLMMDIRDAAVANADYLRDPATFVADESHAGVDVLKLVGEGLTVAPDVLWSCTNCGACVEQCPVDIEHIDHIANLRRFQVLAESDFPSELAGLFKNLETKGNPWGRNRQERAGWVEQARRDGIEVPVFGEDVHDFTDVEYLFWVGCAGAFDDAGKRTTRAVVELLHTAGVKFAVLSKGEACTGDPARRAGNEFLFQQLAAENTATLNSVFAGVPVGQRKIITTCPHCFNTLRNEYPDFDGHFDVFHHTQLLNRLVREKLLVPIPRSPENRAPVTYHDPCFLGRHNKVFDPPRELVAATGANLVEMPRNRDEGFCCGAGGAQMFMEEKLGSRINENRAAEAVGTGAGAIAVGCPFCNTMMSGGVKAVADSAPAVRDVAQMLNDAVRTTSGDLPAPRAKAFLDTPSRIPLSPQPSTTQKHKPASAPATQAPQSHTPPTPPVITPPTATPPAAPPTATPPTAVPPAAVPPTAVPPVATPPAAVPPVATPPAAVPPAAVPPVATPPATTPPAVVAPTAVPPVATPPAVAPPAPPAAVPPTAVPPVATPPAAVPPAAVPPVATPPAATPPVTVPPVVTPPAAVPPAAATPPAAVPPTAVPPAAVPPTAVPPVATPPTAVPPAAAPPVAMPPASVPPVATPPAATPPAAVPPTAVPPAATPPAAVPPVATPPAAF
ncbi:MAG: (Fe-S)-binding protein, partial [Corynebacterium sp.]|uniref:(Fe-S)-binding protein n=1 Tax=Corynebacterium sp. TaxID=1720 RepID=UPI0026DBA630